MNGPAIGTAIIANPIATVAMRIAEILHRLGFVRKGHLVAVTRDARCVGPMRTPSVTGCAVKCCPSWRG